MTTKINRLPLAPWVKHMIVAALVIGVSQAIASIPRAKDITNDAAIYQSIHEIKLTKSNPDHDIEMGLNKLSAQEKRHHRAIPLRLTSPMDRIEKMEYRPSQKAERRSRER